MIPQQETAQLDLKDNQLRGVERRSSPNPVVLPFVSVVVVLFSITLLLYVYTTAIEVEQTALQLPYQNELKPLLRTGLIQGWSFFTKNPQDEELNLLSLRSGQWVTITSGPPSALHNFIGLRRTERAKGVEAGLLTSELKTDKYTTCKGAFETCLDEAKIYTVSNPSSVPLLCGRLGFILQKPLPWAWWDFRNEVVIPSRVMNVEVVCE